jgi:hypothetical protein
MIAQKLCCHYGVLFYILAPYGCKVNQSYFSIKRRNIVKKCLGLLVLVGAFALAGCTSVSYETFAVTNNPIGSKVGEVDPANGGILQAAQNGGINKIATVELRTTAKHFFKAILSETKAVVVTGE